MNNNTVELLGHYGSDTIHAQSAWTSTSRDITSDKIERIPELLKMLVKNIEGNPFQHTIKAFNL